MELADNHGERLRAVFDLCDSEKKGYISVNHFVDLARENFGAGADDQDTEDLHRIVTVLDPEGDGRIHFGEFCQGVKQILELKSPGSPTMSMNGPCLLPALRPQVLGSEQIFLSQDEDANSSGTHETSELSTFNEYDMMTDDDATPLVSHSLGQLPDGLFPGDVSLLTALGSEDDRDSAFSVKSSESHEPRPEIEGTDEEVGVYFDGGGQPPCESGSESGTPSKHKTGEVSMSWCARRRSRDYDRKDWRHARTHRRVTSNGLASQLYRVNPERRNSYGSDEIFDDIDGNFLELNDKVQKLEAQITFLTENQHSNDSRHIRLKEENCSLVERVHLLEEQVRDVETKSQEKLAEEDRKHREAMSRMDKEKAQEIEILSQSLKHIEEEYQSLKEEAPRLRVENDRLRRENGHLEAQLLRVHQQLSQLSDEYSHLQERNINSHSDMEQERKVSAQLIDELSRELDDLRTKMEASDAKLTPQKGDITRTQRKELEAKINRLKEENAHLREEKEEMLLSSQVQEGRSLVNGGMSLADEIENLPKDELLKTVRDLQSENDSLRQYIDRMTLRIIEKNPSILEIPLHKTTKRK